VLDGRTLVARRRRELIAIYARLGGAARSAKANGSIFERRELTALAEQSRARAMREGASGAGELTAMVRLEEWRRARARPQHQASGRTIETTESR